MSKALRSAAWMGAFAFAYLYAFPFFGRLKSANELPRVLMAQEMVERRTFAIDARLAEMGSLFDVATAPDGRKYPNKAPGLSLLAAPVQLVVRTVAPARGRDVALSTWLFRVVLVTVPALLFLPVFLRVARRFAPPAGDRAARAALCAYGLGSMMLPYSLLFMSHVPPAVAIGTAFAVSIAVARKETPRTGAATLAVGALGGLAVLCDYQAALGAGVVALHALAGSARRGRAVLLLAAGAAPFAALLLFVHWTCFGSAWMTGYSFSPHEVHREGLLGIVGPNRLALRYVLLAPEKGLLVMSPWVVLSVVGAVAIARDPAARARVGTEAASAAAMVAGYVLLVGSLAPEFARAGWSVGPRYLAVAIPFLGWLAAAGLAAVDGRPALRVVAHASVLVGVIVHVLAATTYPHWPDTLGNPLFEVSMRALREGLAPHSLGTFSGLSGLPSLLPLYAVMAGLSAWLLGGAPPRRAAATLASAALAAVIVFGGYSRFQGSGQGGEAMWQFIRGTWEPVP